MTATLVKRIDALLPQTQCTKCGYQGCLPYAEAIAADHAPINRCPPGGEAGIAALAALLGRPILPLDADCGADLSLQPHRVAVIDEQVCIGCAKCLKPCPTDAIVGANKFMHSVLPQFCTACELCIPACPVDCIRMEVDTGFQRLPDADDARRRFQSHQARLERDQRERAATLAQIEAVAVAHDHVEASR